MNPTLEPTMHREPSELRTLTAEAWAMIPDLMPIARRIIPDEPEAMATDAVQEVIRLEFGKYVADTNGLKAYLTNSVRNWCRKELKRREPLIPIDRAPLAVLTVSPVEPPDVDELQRCLANLKPIEREVLLMRYLHDRSYAEVAEELGVTVEYARVIEFRALQKMRRLLGRN